jgi:type IV pilus assembly protein PilO
MSWSDELRLLDIQEPASWPAWFMVAMSLLISILLLFGGWHFLIQDQQRVLDLEQSRETELRRTFSSKKGMVVNLPAYQKQMSQIEDMLAVMVRQLPDGTEVPSLLVDITEGGARRGLNFLVFDPQQEELGDFYAILPIRMEVAGSYHQLAGFISDLAQMPRIVTVGDMAITADEAGLLTISVILKTYRYLSEEI